MSQLYSNGHYLYTRVSVMKDINPSRGKLDGPVHARNPVFTTRTPVTNTIANPSSTFHYNKPRSPWHFFSNKRLLKGAVALVVVFVLFLGVKALLATNRIIARNNSGSAPALAGDIDPTKLRGEGDGRINILLLGIGGPGHQGSDLSDTVMVVSIDPRTKDVAMLGIPRDLYVPIPGYGSAKINAAHAYGEQHKSSGGGPALAKKTVEQLLDLPIHYYARVDFSGFKKAVDAVGGVDLTVDKAIYDPYFPADRGDGYKPFSVKAGYQHMKGDLALQFVRSRYTTSDFDRASRQQKVMLALRDKTLSVGTLTNPAKISGLIDAIGNHARTDLQLHEIKKLAEIAKDIDASKVINKVLDTSSDGLLVNSTIGGGYVEVPKAGLNNFSEIRQFVHSIFVDNYLKEEGATIEVQNGTSRPNLAANVSKLLKGYGYNVERALSADNQNYPSTIIYDYTDGKKPYTIRYLENRFNVKARKANPPNDGTPTSNIKIILGSDYRMPTN
jgi:LCP family protein required for cell wall assembly